MVDLVVLMNRPQRDQALLKGAGIALDRALFPLLVGIERFGPIAVGDLADRAGRDHTTISRQIAKLVDLGLVDSRPSARDRRVNEATITRRGQKLAAALQGARQRIAEPILSKWSEKDFRTLVRLMRRFVDDLIALPESADESKA
ncbi:MAG TPA: MarR family transcriptional regulator [Myxococcota bacterium]|nr:MarR family transcriptional regulator [Myxococcota bacterium]